MFETRLKETGFSVSIALDAYEGVRLAHHAKPDLMVLDLKLPAGGGLSVLKNIRASAHTRLIPVVALTGMKDEAYRKEVPEEGVEAFLEKPYDPNTVVDTIKSILK